MTHALLGRLTIVVLCAAATMHAMDQVVIAHGDSVPARLLVKAPGPIRQGDYVRLWITHPILGPTTQELTKQVVCVPGERLHFDGTFYRCNGRWLGGVLRETWDHRPLTRFRFEGVIPPGQLFVLGSHPRSFDSRYIGLIDASTVQRLVAVF